jgi:molybdate transport system regulatory protein
MCKKEVWVVSCLKVNANFKLWLEVGGRPIIGDGRAELLEEINKVGSLSKAAKNLGISYRHAHDLVDNLNDRCGVPIIETSIGGSDGGGMRVTDYGMKLVNEFALLKKDISKYIKSNSDFRKV